MKKIAFISYALRDSEQYVLTLLSNLLREEGFSIESSYDDYNDILSHSTYNNILDSTLFIGLITQYGDRNDNVFREWKLALKNNIPNLLLVEGSIHINEELRNQSNVLVFNRHYPDDIIRDIKQQIAESKRIEKSKQSNNALGWILGGIAAIVIIKLLSD
jgi:hypothetical protein